MHKDYQPYFQDVFAGVTRLGYVSVNERAYDAEFNLHNGWRLSFEGERYYGPMFTILLIPPMPTLNRKRGYEVGLLMRAFEELEVKSYGKPTIENQIEFLLRERDKIFLNPAYYESQYAKVNDREL